MNYNLSTPIPAEETRKDIAETFRKWGLQRGCRADFTIGHGRDESATIEYQLPPDPLITLRHGEQWNFRSNLRALYLAVEALRMNEKRGIADVVREAYMALPAPEKKRDPWEVLGLRPDADAEDIEAMYRAKAKRLHPDMTEGDDARMKELNAAYEEVRK